MTHLYVAVPAAGPTFVKVGWSADPVRRVQKLKRDIGERMRLYAAVSCDGYEALRVEQMAHGILKRHGLHLSGECFRATPQVALWAVYSAVRRVKRRYKKNGRLRSGRPDPGGESYALFYGEHADFQWLGYWSRQYGNN